MCVQAEVIEYISEVCEDNLKPYPKIYLDLVSIKKSILSKIKDVKQAAIILKRIHFYLSNSAINYKF